MEDVGCKARERGPASLERRSIPRSVDEELACFRRRLAAGKRDVEERDSPLFQARGEPLRVARRNG